ncbi:NERD domain-containing protein [Pseudoalteromonas luteoviolacea]|uniref:NERD domain-containing protein n=1 Tax=Pseudoalteromonas luteoviolacea H33 TaxID=1365251 RepID=A0A167B4I5_9GAMM|nr:NERD domain-containing protein [Pseudoalteromonas luteoviolacea]KZN46152.1 hypothetical protein N476_03250 [Pseudoalteromonas luteoviolacea H33]KZN75193.1 hypothetical protein N477_20145 [Pseudoalteromonas luteoviolacea H33-S]MBQ4875791.1 NERD domain-containing protein [Pseudoalteromonas luteoviolacea]MBQ4904826.1 NERD domain-containing protein [Pseudoalteromonas luteoviolacea]
MNRWILFLLLLSGWVKGMPAQLDASQCERYATELALLQSSKKMSDTDQARIFRLTERIEQYCQSPTQIVNVTENHSNLPVFGASQFRDPKVYSKWQAFYEKPIICHDGEQTFQSAVRCAELVAEQKQAFEALLAQQNKLSEQAERAQVFAKPPVISGSVASLNSIVPHSHELPNTLDDNIEKQPDHFTRFGFWLSIVLCGYIVIELAKRFLSKDYSTSYSSKKRSFKKTYDVLSSKLDKKKYIIVHRSMSPLLEELDIDGVVLSPFGVFVFICSQHVGEIEANLHSEMWHVTKEGSAQFFLNPLNSSKVRAGKLAKYIGAKSGVRHMVAFNNGCRFYPGRPANCFENSQVALEVMRYTQFLYSYEQLRYFEQRLYSASHVVASGQEVIS